MSNKTFKTNAAGRPGEYQDGFADLVLAFRECPQSLMVRGKLSNAKLGKLCGNVSGETVRKWRQRVPGREAEYKAAFAAACQACQAAIDTDAIKRSMAERAIGFVQKKVERRIDEKTGKLVVVKEEKVTMAGDVAAAKLVLPNTQKGMPDEEKWDVGDKIENTHEVGKSLADFLKDLA